jgi:hypothetical protein
MKILHLFARSGINITINFNTQIIKKNNRGLYIGKYPPPGGGEKYQPMLFGGKNMKSVREKGGNVKEKEERGKKKEERGKKMRKGEEKG